MIYLLSIFVECSDLVWPLLLVPSADTMSGGRCWRVCWNESAASLMPRSDRCGPQEPQLVGTSFVFSSIWPIRRYHIPYITINNQYPLDQYRSRIMWLYGIYPLVISYSLLLKPWPIEIVDLPMNSMVIVQFANCKRLPEAIYHPRLGIELGWIWCLRYFEPLKMWKLERFEAPQVLPDNWRAHSKLQWFMIFIFQFCGYTCWQWHMIFFGVFFLPSWHSNECILFSLETAGGFSHQASEIRSRGYHCSAWKNMCWMGLRVHYGSFGGFLWFGVAPNHPKFECFFVFFNPWWLGDPPFSDTHLHFGFPQRWLDCGQNQQNMVRGPHLPSGKQT